jgi:hypothetical protein
MPLLPNDTADQLIIQDCLQSCYWQTCVLAKKWWTMKSTFNSMQYVSTTWITSHWDQKVCHCLNQSFTEGFWSWNSSISIVTRLRIWWLQNQTIAPGLLLTQPPTQRVVWAFPWNKAAGHGSNHSSLPSNDVNNVLELHLHSPMSLWCSP